MDINLHFQVTYVFVFAVKQIFFWLLYVIATELLAKSLYKDLAKRNNILIKL